MAGPRYTSAEVKVGLFLAFCIALLAAMLLSYSRLAPVWRGRQELHVAFDNIGSLRLDAPVRYNGYEVGRVKWMRLLHLDDEALERLQPHLNKRHLDNLPLRPDTVKRDLRAAAEEDFPIRCRNALRDRTMIELCLEVLQEGDVKRYRLDDQVRITSTVLGDAAVEIISGSGATNKPGSEQLLLGMSGDFFSNLAKSMGEVKEILSGVTDVVGAPERRSFERAQNRFGPINDEMDKIVALAERRSEATLKRFDGLSAVAKKAAEQLSGFPEQVQPRVDETGKRLKEGLASLRDRFNDMQTEAGGMFDEVSADMKTVRADIKAIGDKSRPDFEKLRASFRQAYDSVSSLDERLEDGRDRAGCLAAESQPDIARAVDALKNSLTNLIYTGAAAMENKDLMIGSRDKGEHEYNTALDIYRRVTFATRRMRDAGAEARATARMLRRLEDGPSATAALAMDTSRELAAVRQPLDAVHREIEEAMLPPFVRKKAAWRTERE
jgi:ABC-type transporter Mla subunit MlaD